ncbi:hypothetical protein G9A89_003253 [Geosiphon pyriformis]|nr:hypothetical protein G9A89_003253 [Geosiphon pyriformis]
MRVLAVNNKFKVVTTPDTTTLEYHQSIYTHCKQKFNISDGIEVVKKSVYQYIENRINNYLFRNYNISKVRSNLYNNLVHYSQLGTEDLNSKTLATYFQELNFNIIEYCEEKYSVQPKYSFNFELETETSNKGKQKVKQYSRTTPNTPILPKTTAKHLQTPEQRTSVKLPLSITSFPISLIQPQTPSLPLDHFSRPEDFQSSRNSTQQQKPISTSANIIDYLQKNKSNHSESLESEETEPEPKEATENEEEMATAYIAKIPEFMGKNNDTSSQEWLDKVQKAGDANGWNAARMLKAILYFLQGTTEEWFENLEELFENWQAFKDAFLQQFTDNNTSITLRNQTNDYYSDAQILDQFIARLKDKLIKKVRLHVPADLATAIRHAKNYEMAIEEMNHTKLVNLAIEETTILQTNNNSSNNHKNINHHSDTTKTTLDHHPTTNLKIVTIVEFQDTGNEIAGNYKEINKTGVINIPPTQQYQVPARRLNNNNRINLNNQLVPRNSGQQRPNYYYTQPSYLTIPEESDFQQSALSKANESLFLLNNAAANEQKAITAMYTEATVEGKPIRLILDSGSARTDGMKKTPVEEIDNFLFTIDRITIPVKVLVMDAPQYQALELKISYQGQYTIVFATCGIFNKQSEKAPVFEFEEEKKMPLTETYMAFGSTSNWAEETEQEIFEESRGWKKKQPPYIPLKCKDCNKKLLSMEACISPEEEYETCIYYFCKTCHRERFGSPKRSEKWDNTLCLTCGDIRGVCDQTCQYALSISEKVRRGTPFDAAYNSALNKFYHYLHDAKMIFDLAMALINEATQENVCQIKEAEYIEYTMKLAEFDYEDKVETYHQIASHIYPTQEAQIQ